MQTTLRLWFSAGYLVLNTILFITYFIIHILTENMCARARACVYVCVFGYL